PPRAAGAPPPLEQDRQRPDPRRPRRPHQPDAQPPLRIPPRPLRHPRRPARRQPDGEPAPSRDRSERPGALHRLADDAEVLEGVLVDGKRVAGHWRKVLYHAPLETR